VVRFLEGKLDELYSVLRGPRYAEALLEAKGRLWEHDYHQALRLVQSAREAYAAAPAKEWQRRAAARFRGKDPGEEISGLFARALDLLQTFARAQPPPETVAAGPPLAADFGRPATADQPRPDEPEDLPASRLDAAAFTLLLTAARQSGLVPRADAIVAVRDRDFRAGHYQRSLDVIEGLYTELTTDSERRSVELRREELQFKSGTLKMSPKEWMARQRRVRDQTQKIDRARRYFARVLDGLRALRAANPE
jgi:hypothetical protein